MKFAYGPFLSEEAEFLPEFFGQQRTYNARGRAQTIVKTLSVRCDVVKTSQATVHTRLEQIRDAFAMEGGEARFILDTGANSIYHLPTNGARSIRILHNDFWTEEGKAHYATGHPARITLQGEYLVSDGDPLISYSETITFVGTGGPRRATVELDAGIPIEQIVSTNTPVYVIQSGEAVGSVAYPVFNEPIFPSQVDLPDGFQRSQGAPRVDGLAFVDWPVRWNYRMTLPAFQTIPSPLLR